MFKPSLDHSALPLLCPPHLASKCVTSLSVVNEEHVPLVTQNLSVCGGSRPEWSSDYDVIFFYISPSSFLCFFYFCMCHAVRGKSLQPDCEMMSQIHKTLTSSFQLLFIIYHPYFIFLWEDLYGCVQAYMCWRTLGCVCCCGCAHVSVHWLCMELYNSYTQILTNLWVLVCHLSDVNLFLTSGLALRLKWQSNLAAPLKLSDSHSFHYSSSLWLWLLCFLAITTNPVHFKVGVVIVL